MNFLKFILSRLGFLALLCTVSSASPSANVVLASSYDEWEYVCGTRSEDEWFSYIDDEGVEKWELRAGREDFHCDFVPTGKYYEWAGIVNDLNPRCTYSIYFAGSSCTVSGTTSWSGYQTGSSSDGTPSISVTELFCEISPCSIELTGPSEVVEGCTGTWELKKNGCEDSEFTWWYCGAPIGDAGDSISLTLYIGGSVTYRVTTSTGEEASITTTVKNRVRAPYWGSWGTFKLECPDIQPAMFVNGSGGQTLGMVHCPSPKFSQTENPTCEGWELAAAAFFKVEKHYYDIGINNQRDINRVIAAEREHVATFETLIAALEGAFAANSGEQSNHSECTTRLEAYRTAKNIAWSIFLLANKELDEPGGPHQTLAADIISNGGYNG